MAGSRPSWRATRLHRLRSSNSFAYNWEFASLVHAIVRSAQVSAVYLDLIAAHPEFSEQDVVEEEL